MEKSELEIMDLSKAMYIPSQKGTQPPAIASLLTYINRTVYAH